MDCAIVYLCVIFVEVSSTCVKVLQELDRRIQVEDQVRWDFQALDHNGSYRISVNDALLLFRNTHGPSFSMATWQRFLASRGNPKDDVSYDEVRMWLCDSPNDSPTQDNEVTTEQTRLQQLQQRQAEEDFEALKKTKVFCNIYTRNGT